jgi:riboflavin synthase
MSWAVKSEGCRLFTGLIETVGRVENITHNGSGAELTVDIGKLSVSLGDSLAVNGVCLTADDIKGSRIRMSVMPETVRLTNLGALHAGDEVNLERALCLGKPLGGHFVSGHIDAIGEITELKTEGNALLVTVAVPAELMSMIAVKGSITVEGISLTVVAVRGNCFTVSLVGYTKQVTTMKKPVTGRRVNVEVDILARYIKRLLEVDSKLKQDKSALPEQTPSLLEEWLKA